MVYKADIFQEREFIDAIRSLASAFIFTTSLSPVICVCID